VRSLLLLTRVKGGFTDAAVREQPMLDFAKRVHLEFNPNLADSSEGRPSKVEVRLKDGKILSRYVEYAKGGPQAPLSAQEMRAKFVDCARRAIDEAAIQGRRGIRRAPGNSQGRP
jgi:2-methylcitrate dehydratase PrpD